MAQQKPNLLTNLLEATHVYVASNVVMEHISIILGALRMYSQTGY